MRAKHKTHKRANPASGLFNQTVQSKRWLYRAIVSLHPLLLGEFFNSKTSTKVFSWPSGVHRYC